MSWIPGQEGFNWNLPVHALDLPNEPWPGNDEQSHTRGVSVDRYAGRTTNTDQGERPR